MRLNFLGKLLVKIFEEVLTRDRKGAVHKVLSSLKRLKNMN